MAITQPTDVAMLQADDRTSGFNRGVGVAGTLLGIGSLWYLVAEAIAAAGFPGYSYAYNYISDLGVPELGGVIEGHRLNSELATVMNAGFLGQAIMMTLAGVVLCWSLPAGRSRNLTLILALVHSFGISLVALVHGSPANVAAGLMVFHGLGAGMAIIGGNALAIVAGSRALSFLSPTLSRVSIGLGVLGVISCVVHFASKTAGVVSGLGISERGGVYSIMLWQLVVAVQALRAAKTR